MRIVVVAASCLLSLPAFAELSFPVRIPNGNNAPGATCLYCHNSSGGGATAGWNAFGDFLFTNAGCGVEDLVCARAAVDAQPTTFPFWNATICGDDSDGDGATNGEELGDPDCVWTQGDTPAREDDISYPGDPDSTPADTGEGEGEGDTGGGDAGCSSTHASGTPLMGALALLTLMTRGRRRR